MFYKLLNIFDEPFHFFTICALFRFVVNGYCVTLVQLGATLCLMVFSTTHTRANTGHSYKSASKMDDNVRCEHDRLDTVVSDTYGVPGICARDDEVQ